MNYKLRYILAAAFILIIISSCSEINNRDMTVVKDCTGSYLRFNNKDYHICNYEIVDEFDDETEVKASFNKIETCPNIYDLVVCEMYHKNEGLINVTKIEKK